MKLNLPRYQGGKQNNQVAVNQQGLVEATRKIRKLKYSVCIITNNAEKNIRRTMESLMPLIQAVPGEIIVTDTGCTDSTMDIVHEYTQKTNFFKWCNDFGAARSAGLAIADGEWIIVIDNDEWFEDISEIIEFFQNGECDQYHSAKYSQRNYRDFDGSDYTDHPRLSMARNVQGLHYEGLVHENFSTFYFPCKIFSCYVHHYGYAKKKGEKTYGRNLPLLEKGLEEAPNNHHLLSQIANEYLVMDEYDKSIYYCERCLAIPADRTGQTSPEMAVSAYLAALKEKDENQRLLDVGKDFLENWNLPTGKNLVVYYYMMIATLKLKNWDEVISNAQGYFECYDKIEKNPSLLTEKTWAHPGEFGSKQYYYLVLNNMTGAYIEKRDYETAKANLFQMNPEDMVELGAAPYVNILRIASESKDSSVLPRFYEHIYQVEELENKFIYTVKNKQSLYPDKIDEFMDAIATAEVDTPYLMLVRLILADKQENKEKTATYFKWFFENGIVCNGIYGDVILTGMKYDLDVWPLVSMLDMEDWTNLVNGVSSNPLSDDMKYMTLYSMKHNPDLTSFQQAYWFCTVKEKICLNGSFDEQEGIVAALWDYADILAAYAHRLYRDEMFEPENLPYLPRVYRFARHMELAKQQKADGHLTEHINSLKNAMDSYPVVRKQMKVLIDKFEYEQLAENRHAQEFFELAKQVKQQIEVLLTQKQAAQARALIEELSSLLPNDGDLQKYRLMAEQIETESLAQNVKQ